MHFLVTGGAGFIGSALANRLIADGHSVSVLDDLSNGEQQRLNPAITFVQGDIDNIPLLWSLLPEVDCVYHLAARVSVAQSILHPRHYNRVNVGGTVSLMEAMRDTGVRRVVFTSSGAVYGKQGRLPVRETDSPHPDSPYAVSKWSAEQYIHTIGELWGMETVALRIFNAYGPNQSLPMSHAPVIPRFLQQALTGGSVVLFGQGEQTRDFVYVDDVVDGLVSSAIADAVNRGIINIGSGQETSIRTLVSEIERVTGQEINLISNSSKRGGVPRLVADISRAKELLDFQPRIGLEEGLRLTLARDGRFAPFDAPAAAVESG
ncbi:MAG: NAD-dependent epimerase/dehydratase family protein [Candidatus Promineifilaceae bacterium]|jgi:UDP-glucose 4-epimerase